MDNADCIKAIGDIYTSSGHKFFPPEGNVYDFDDGSNNPYDLPDGFYAVEQITDKSVVTGLRFTEVEPPFLVITLEKLVAMFLRLDVQQGDAHLSSEALSNK